MIGLSVNIGVRIDHRKADKNLTIIDQQRLPLRLGKIGIEVPIMVITGFVHFIIIVGCHLIEILLMDIP